MYFASMVLSEERPSRDHSLITVSGPLLTVVVYQCFFLIRAGSSSVKLKATAVNESG